MSAHPIGEFLKHLEIAGKSMTMYSEQHPSAKNATEQAFSLIQEGLQTRPNLTISVVGADILVDGEPVERGDRAVDRFLKHLDARNIRSLTFYKNLTLVELVSFLRILNYVPQRLRDQGGIESVLDKEAITGVQANKVRYGIIGDGTSQATGGVSMSMDEGLMSQLLMSMQPSSDLKSTAENVEQSLESSEGPDASAALFRIFQNVAQGSVAEPTRPIRESFLEMFRSFSPKMQGKLLLTAISNRALLEKSSLSGFYHDLRPDELELPITAVLLLEQVSEGELKRFADALLADEKLSLSETIRQKMVQRGWITEPTPDAADSKRKQGADESELAAVIQQIGTEIGSGNLDEADRLSKKIVSGLNGAQPAQRIATIQALPSLIEKISAHERWKNVETSLSFVIANLLKKENDDSVFNALSQYLANGFFRRFANKDYPGCKEVLAQLTSRTDKKEVLFQSLGAALSQGKASFQIQLKDGSAGTETALDYLKNSGRPGADFLLEWLAEEEDQRVRSRIITYAEKVDQASLLPEMEKRLQDPRWYVVRNMVTITGRLNLPHAVPFMTRAMENEDIRVAKEVVKALFKSISPANAPLVIALLQHYDKSIRLQALRLVTLFGLERGEARVLLQKLAATDTVPEVRTLASSILG